MAVDNWTPEVKTGSEIDFDQPPHPDEIQAFVDQIPVTYDRNAGPEETSRQPDVEVIDIVAEELRAFIGGWGKVMSWKPVAGKEVHKKWPGLVLHRDVAETVVERSGRAVTCYVWADNGHFSTEAADLIRQGAAAHRQAILGRDRRERETPIRIVL